MANTLEIIVKATDKASGTLKGITKGLDSFHSANAKTLKLLSKIGKATAVALTAAATSAIAMGADMVKTAISVETAFAGVIKTTEGLTSDFGVLNAEGLALKSAFKDLAETKPIAVEELMRIGELGGQLGIGKDALIEFSSVIADLGVSTALTTDAAAMDIARLMNIMSTAGEDVSRLGSVIVDLGNNFATTEPEILSFAERIAGSAAVVGMSEPAVLALGAAFSSVGVLAEAGGTAVQKVLIDIHSASIQGAEGLAGYAKVAGLSAEAFATMWKDDAGSAFAMFVEGLGKQGDAAIRTLAELGIGDARQVRSFLALGAAGDLVTRSMEMANEAWKENTALTIEASQRYATTESQLQMLKNQWRNLKDTLGSQLLPVVNQFVGLFAKFAQEHGPAFVKLIQRRIAPAIDDLVKAIGYLEKGEIGASLAMLFGGKFASDVLNTARAVRDFITPIVEFVRDHAEAFKAALITIGAVLAGAAIAGAITSIATAVAGLLNPIGLVIAAVALLAQAWINDWGGIRTKLTEVWEEIRPKLEALWAWLQENIPAAIATLKAKWEELKTNWKLDEKWTAITDWFAKVYDWLQVKIPEAINKAIEWWWKLKAAWGGGGGSDDPLAESSGGSGGQPTFLERLVAQAGELYRKLAEDVNPQISALRALLEPMPENLLNASPTSLEASSEAMTQEAIRVAADKAANPNVTTPTFWDKLLFALKDVWQFISVDLTTLLRNFINLELTALETAILAVRNALISVWQWITGWMLPGIQAFATETVLSEEASRGLGGYLTMLGDTIIANLLKKIADLRTKVNGLATAFDRARTALEKLNAELRASPVMGQSPSPFELSVLGASEAMRGMAHNELPALSRGMAKMNALSGGVQGVMAKINALSGGVQGIMAVQSASIRSAQAAGNVTNNNSYNLTVHTSARSESIVGDFAMLRAMTA